MNFFNQKNKRIITIILAVILTIAMIAPMIASYLA